MDAWYCVAAGDSDEEERWFVRAYSKWKSSLKAQSPRS